MSEHSAFFRVQRTPTPTREGPVELPITYYDSSELVALFEADAAVVRRKLAPLGLSPALMRGRAQVALVFFEYRKTSIGPYNEVGLATFCVRAGNESPPLAALEMLRDPRKRTVGSYIFDLPVTTAIANAAGRELWGYPKFVTEIPIDWHDRSFRGRVLDPGDGSAICELGGSYTRGLPMPAPGLLLYSRRGTTDLRTVVDARGRGELALGGTLRLTVGPSKHGMAANLLELGLQGARPQLVLAAKRACSLLHAGEPW